MIQIKRGSTKNWIKQKKALAAGQPGYDKDKNKIKIGDGEHSWSELPYASGLNSADILLSEDAAKARILLDKDDTSLITYGIKSPDKNTVGQLYLQYYDAEPEVDYIISTSITPGGWKCQKWKSGIARCFITIDFTTTIQNAIGSKSLYESSASMETVNYPFSFSEVPCEVATVQSPGGFVWLASSKETNSKNHTASYHLVSMDKVTNNTTYKISLQVEGLWK